MKDITLYITESTVNSSNKDAMFLGKDCKRNSEEFTFNVGEKALLIKYDTHGQLVQLRGIIEIEKVLKNSVKIKGDEDMTEFYHGLKFDKTGIAIQKDNNKYLGKSIRYWVLYTKELIESEVDGKDIKELLEDGNCSWGFSFRDKKEGKKDLKKYLKELK